MVRQGLGDSARRETDKMDKTEMVRSDVDKGVTRFRLEFGFLLVRSRPVCSASEMTYIVSSGALNSTPSIHPVCPKPGADITSCTCTRETVAPKALKLRNHRRPRNWE